MTQRYTQTLGTIRRRLTAAFPDAKPVEGASDDISHTLWMIDRVACIEDQGKIDRWVGWIGAKAHSLGLIDHADDGLTEGRYLIAADLDEAHERG